VAAAVHPAPICGAAHLRGHLVEGEVQGCHLVHGGRLGPDHRSLRERGELESYGAVVLARVALTLDLDLDPHDAVVVLLESRQLLGDVTPESIRQLAVPTRDHNFHVNLPLLGWFLQTPLVPSGGQDETRARKDPWLGVDGARPADLVFDPTIAC
jgi:hypothetical protein